MADAPGLPRSAGEFIAVLVDDRVVIRSVRQERTGGLSVQPGRPYYIQTLARDPIVLGQAIRKAARIADMQIVEFELNIGDFWLPAVARVYPDTNGPPGLLVVSIHLNLVAL